MRSVILAILLSASVAACGDTNEGDKAVAERPQEKPLRDKPGAASGTFDAAHKGDAAPTLAFEGEDGGAVTLAAFRGKPVLVNLWATWCAPCLAEMPALDRLAKTKAGELSVVGVSQDLQGWTKVRPFLARTKLGTMTIVLDKTGALATALGAGGLPMTVLYDEAGREVWRVSGPREWDKPGGFVGVTAKTGFRAVGQEPGWMLELSGGTLKVLADYGDKTATFRAPETVIGGVTTSIALDEGGHSLAVAIERKPCADSMSGAPYDYQVTMKLDGREYRGCGEKR